MVPKALEYCTPTGAGDIFCGYTMRSFDVAVDFGNETGAIQLRLARGRVLSPHDLAARHGVSREKAGLEVLGEAKRDEDGLSRFCK